MKQIVSIQYLRAIAAAAVVFHHAAERTNMSIGVGAAGVDVFFVVSGFIMYTVTADRRPSARSFMWNRLIRVVPMYWLSTLVLVAAACVFPTFLPRLHPGAAEIVKSLLFIPYRDDAGNIFPVVVAGWTLNYEMIFYFLCAVALTMPERMYFRIIVITIAVFVFTGLFLTSSSPIATTYTQPILLEFAAGLVLGRARRNGQLPGFAGGSALIVFAMAVLVTLQVERIAVDTWRAAMWGIPAACIVAGTLGIEAAGRLPTCRALSLAGDASYSTYLLHPQLVAAIMFLFGDNIGFGVSASIVGSMALGYAVFCAIERPCTAWLRQFPANVLRMVPSRGQWLGRSEF